MNWGPGSGSRIRVPVSNLLIININILRFILINNTHIINIHGISNMNHKDYNGFGSRVRVPDPGPGSRTRMHNNIDYTNINDHIYS